MNTGHLTVAWLPGGGYSVVDREHNTIGRYGSREVAAAHHALALEEIARLREVVRSLREFVGGMNESTAAMLGGLAWTVEAAETWRAVWDAETERLAKDSLTSGNNDRKVETQ